MLLGGLKMSTTSLLRFTATGKGTYGSIQAAGKIPKPHLSSACVRALKDSSCYCAFRMFVPGRNPRI